MLALVARISPQPSVRGIPDCSLRLRAYTRRAGSLCNAMRYAFAGIRSRYTELTAATELYLIQTQKKTTVFSVNAKHSKSERLLTPSSA